MTPACALLLLTTALSGVATAAASPQSAPVTPAISGPAARRAAPITPAASATPKTVPVRVTAPRRRFGHTDVVTIGGTSSFSLQQAYGTPNQLTFFVQPEVGFFVVRHVLVGGALSLRYVHALKTGQTTFGIGPFAAYQLNIADAWDFLPTVGLMFGFQQVSSEMGSAVVNNTGSVTLLAKFLWSVAPPLQISVAPYFTHTLYNRGPQAGGYGVALGFQGWL